MNSSDTEEEEENNPNTPSECDDYWNYYCTWCNSPTSWDFTSPTDNSLLQQLPEKQYNNHEENNAFSSQNDSGSRVDGFDPHLRDSESRSSMQIEQSTPLRLACNSTNIDAMNAQLQQQSSEQLNKENGIESKHPIKVDFFLELIKKSNINFQVPDFSKCSTTDKNEKIYQLKEVFNKFSTRKGGCNNKYIICMHNILFTNFLGLKFVPNYIVRSFEENYFNYIANDADKIIEFVEANRKNITKIFFANYKYAKNDENFSSYQKKIIIAIETNSTEDKPYVSFNRILNYLLKYYPDLSEIKDLKTTIKIQLTKLKNHGVITQKRLSYKLNIHFSVSL